MDRSAKKRAAIERLAGVGQTPEQPQDDYDTPTERLQDDYEGPMKDYRVRLPESWWQELKRRAAARGLKPSQLIREIVSEYLRK